MARSIARALGLDEDLAEALALAHAISATRARPASGPWTPAWRGRGFDHNAQSLRVVPGSRAAMPPSAAST